MSEDIVGEIKDIRGRTWQEAFYLQTKAFLENNSEHNKEIERLKAQVERLTKAGDAFISVGVKMREMIGDHHWTLEFDRVRTDWYFAAKEGKQSK
jgi:hypothetical protein